MSNTFFSYNFGNGSFINDNNSNELLQLNSVSSATNFFSITNSATNSNVTIGTGGDDTSVAINLDPKGDGKVNILGSTSNGAGFRLHSTSATDSNYFGFNAPATMTKDVTLILPASDGSANQVLQTNGSGTLSWTNQTGSISGDTFATDLRIGRDADNLIDFATTDNTIALRVNGTNDVISVTNTTSTFNTNIVVPDDGTIGSASATTAMSIDSSGIVTFVDDIKIKDAGTIGSATTPGAISIADNGIVTFVDDIKIKDAGTIGTATTADAIAIAGSGIVTFANNIKIPDSGTIGSASATSAMTIASDGIVTFVDDIKIKDAGTIGSASSEDTMTLSSNGVVTFKDDIMIKSGGTIGSAGTGDAIGIESNGVVSVKKGLVYGNEIVSTATALSLLNPISFLSIGGSDVTFTIGLGHNGLMKHIFFATTGGIGTVSFSGKLVSGSGSGLNQIQFTTTGQSATIVFMEGFWRIINTGGAVA